MLPARPSRTLLPACLAALLAGCSGNPDPQQPDAGPKPPPDAGVQPPACTPKTCASLQLECGNPPDSCGGTLSCGTCVSTEKCSAAYFCECAPESHQALCAAKGFDCGTVDLVNRCGFMVTANCGGCTDPQTCGGAGAANVCGRKSWKPLTPLWPSPATVHTLWGAPGASVLWVGGGTFNDVDMYTWNGAQWAKLQGTVPGVIHSISGTSDSSAWAVGSGGLVLRRTTTGWTTTTEAAPIGSRNLKAVWSSGPTDAWALADGFEHAYRWNGVTWSAYGFSGGASNFKLCHALWGSASNDVWAACEEGETYRWNGTAWTLVQTPTGNHLYGLFGFSSAQVWAVGEGNVILRWDGSDWTEMEAPPVAGFGSAYLDVWGAGPTDLWAVGTLGQIAHFDGTSWTAVPSGTDRDLTAVRGTPTRLFAIGQDALVEYSAD